MESYNDTKMNRTGTEAGHITLVSSTTSPIMQRGLDVIEQNRTVSDLTDSWHKTLVASTVTPIIVLGIIGNILSLLVWVKIRRCKTSTACFLACLAIADLVALLTGINFWMANVVKFDLRFTGSIACKLLVYVDFAAQNASAWIVTLVTAERAIASWLPFRFKAASRPEIALRVTLVTVVAILCACLIFLISIDTISVPTRHNSTMDVCLFTNDSTIVQHEAAWFYFELLSHFLVPFVIIIICNISILTRTVLQAIKRKKHLTENHINRNDIDIFKAIPFRVILLSIVFCLGVGPIHFYGNDKEALQFKLPVEAQMDDVDRKFDSDSMYTIVVILMYLNNAINFLLYCATGSDFRRDIVQLFRKKVDKQLSTQLLNEGNCNIHAAKEC